MQCFGDTSQNLCGTQTHLHWTKHGLNNCRVELRPNLFTGRAKRHMNSMRLQSRGKKNGFHFLAPLYCRCCHCGELMCRSQNLPPIPDCYWHTLRQCQLRAAYKAKQFNLTLKLAHRSLLPEKFNSAPSLQIPLLPVFYSLGQRAAVTH